MYGNNLSGLLFRGIYGTINGFYIALGAAGKAAYEKA